MGRALRDVFGEYRAPTGVALGAARATAQGLDRGSRVASKRVSAQARPPPKFLVGKPGLDGHSNGAEQIAVRAATAAWKSSMTASA